MGQWRRAEWTDQGLLFLCVDVSLGFKSVPLHLSLDIIHTSKCQGIGLKQNCGGMKLYWYYPNLFAVQVLPGVSPHALNPLCIHKYLKLEAAESTAIGESQTRCYCLRMKTSIIPLIMAKCCFHVDIALRIETCVNINQGTHTNE